jgi:hypothetical protein
VADSVRGHGAGRRILRELESLAFGHGAPASRLETSGLLGEAVTLYRSAGDVEVSAFDAETCADHWFRKAGSKSSCQPRGREIIGEDVGSSLLTRAWRVGR